ncbi:MAG: DUF6444 domain-containing protein [Saprospiraceae bacterium]
MDYLKIIAQKNVQIKELEKVAQRVDELTKLLADAMFRISQLESQLKQNSRNSSKPPSTDGPKKKPGLPPKGGKRGGQSGHKGDTIKMSSHVDDLQLCAPKRCGCGKRLLRQDMEIHARRQVFDIPDPKLLVTEYQQLSCSCPACGQLNVM